MKQKTLSRKEYEKYYALWMKSFEWVGITDEEKRLLIKEVLHK